MKAKQTKKQVSTFTTKIHTECQLFENIRFILDKIEGDGNLETLGKIVSLIFSKEMSFAVEGGHKENSGKSSPAAKSST